MISFITRFKVLLISFALILGIELWVAHYPAPTRFTSNFLEFSYLKKEYPPEFIIFKKLELLSKINSEFLLVGDSAGLHGVKPWVVMEHLNGAGFLNMCVPANAGFEGFRHVARYYLQRHKETKYLVFTFDPYSLPHSRGINHEENLTKAIYYNYLSPFRYLRFPIFAWRLNLTNGVYYKRFEHKLYKQDEENEWIPTDETLVAEHGWIGMGGTAVKRKECDFRVQGEEVLTLESELDQFVELAKEFKVKLIVALNPVSCEVGSGLYSDKIQKQLDSFALRHPDVYIPFDLIRTWDANYFWEYSHLTKAGAIPNSHRLGEVLARLLEEDQNIKNFYQFDSSSAVKAPLQLNGILKIQSEDEGYLKSERSYLDGKLNGITKSYYPDGTLMSERMYVRDKWQWAKLYDENGNLLKTIGKPDSASMHSPSDA